ncbi:CRISPR-associated protein Cas4 [Selenomonas noxia]|jgi:CRISPR-associated protein Cas4|uniref:CRISPR-associated protein Cas4 n=1 Tax=Selenomonas noxia TaxID=135083 RepID=UPI00248AAA5C|nr:CRISPR-associated protein Cas4 [Selenomonas noxia]
MSYAEEEYLMLSEIQHYAFCPRQWALIHLEQHWQENVLTVEGNALHEKAHDENIKEKRGNKIVVRGMRVASSQLGISGACDVVEFHVDASGVHIPSYQGCYRIVPIEYKRGKPKEGEEDVLQLTLQALCLEDMLAADIPFGYIYYGEIRRRVKVDFSKELKERIPVLTDEMRKYIQRGYTPRVKRRKGCANCSLNNVCMPKLNRIGSAKNYLERRLAEG